MRLCKHLVGDCRRYTRSVSEFRRTRELLLELVSAEKIGEELRERISSLSAGHGWLVKSLPPVSPSRKGWKLVFEDQFEREQLGPNWTVACGQWAIRNGRLTLLKGEGAILYVSPLSHSQRIEFDAVAERGYPCDLSGLLCSDPTEARGFGSAYFFGFGSEVNAFSKLLIRMVEYMVLPVKAVPRKRHRIICERDGDILSFWVDGKTILRCLHRNKLDGAQDVHAGIYMYFSRQYVDNIKIYAR